jgi:hypothetical protein
VTALRDRIAAIVGEEHADAILALFRDEAPPKFEQTPECDPVCSECGLDFCWNENSDKDDPAPLCDTCAHILAPEVNGLRAACVRLDAERAELQRRLEAMRVALRDREARELEALQELDERRAEREVGVRLSAWRRVRDKSTGPGR